MTDHTCKICGNYLMSDEIAMHMKMFGKMSKEFMCLDCQAEYLRVDRKKLEELIDMFHRRGTCVLFAKYE